MSKSNGFWQQYLPSNLIFSELDLGVLDRLKHIQESRVLIPGINPYVFLLLDDIAADTNLIYGDAIRDLAFNGRHRKFGAVITTQYLKSASKYHVVHSVFRSTHPERKIGTKLRGNSDKIVCFTTSNRSVLDSLYEEFGGDFANKAQWYAFYDRNTRDHHCLIIDATNPDKRGKERYYRYKARAFDGTPGQGPKHFSLGCDVCWGGKENRGRILKKQRKKWAPPPDYKLSTLIHMFNGSFLTKQQDTGVTERVKALYDEDIDKVINLAPDTEEGRAPRHNAGAVYPRRTNVGAQKKRTYSRL